MRRVFVRFLEEIEETKMTFRNYLTFSLAGCQIIPIDLNFHLQKCLEIFDKNSADKI